MKIKFDSKIFGIALFVIYITLIIPLVVLLLKTGDDLNNLAMNPGFITPTEIREDYPKLFFVIIFSFLVGSISILSFLFYIKRNKTSIDFDETIDLEYWEEKQTKESTNKINSLDKTLKTDLHHISELKKSFSALKKDSYNEEKSTIAIQYLCKQFKASFGAIYLTNNIQEEDYLEFSGGYAFFKPKDTTGKILFGEGLTGQVAKSQKPIIINDLQDSQITILSGLGESSPKSIFIIPITLNTKTIGVIEIASFHKITGAEKSFSADVSTFLASEF